MSTQQFLISNFKSGFDQELEPWLLMNDAFVELSNYRTDRGVVTPRRGISAYAQGGRSTAKNEQSRIYSTTTGETVVDSQATFVHVLASSVRPGSVTFSESGGDSSLDDGVGGFPTSATGFSAGATIDYNTGIVSAIWDSGAPTTPVVTYTHANAGVRVTNEEVLDTQSISGTLANIPLNPGSVLFWDGGTQFAYDDGAGGFTGDATAGAINYTTGVYSLTWTVASGADAKVSYTYQTAKPVMGITNFITASNTRKLVVMSTDEFNVYNAATNRFDLISVTGAGTALPTGNASQFFSSTMYPTKASAPRMVFVNDVVADRIYTYDGTNVNRFQNSGDFGDVAGSSWSGNLATALHAFYFGGRLVLIRPRTTNTQYPQRIAWSGINDGSGTGDDFNAAGSGFWEMSTEFYITAAAKLRNSIIIWTTESIWELTVTDDIDLPFRVKQLGDAEARGAQAPFSGITWFGESSAVGHFGITGTDGRDAFRVDNKIPNFSRDRMGGLPSTSSFNPFELISSGTVFEDDQFWFLYPDVRDINQEIDSNTRVLANNFVESSWAVYDLRLTRMGKFQQTTEIVWDTVDGTEQDSHLYWDTTNEKWDDFFDQKFVFFTLCGDRNGFIYKLTDNTDQSSTISAISKADGAVVNTEPDIYVVGDRVTIQGVSGMTEINGGSYTVTATSGNTITIGIDSKDFTTYTSGGVIEKWIPREMETKPFNPFVENNKKCRLKKVHFFFDTDKTSMLLDLKSDRRETAYQVDTQMDDGSNEGLAKKKWTSITVNQVANFHTLRLHQEDGQANERLHAIILECEPVGRLYR